MPASSGGPQQTLSIGAAVRRRRVELGLRTEDLAARSGTSMGTVLRVERGHDVRMTTLDRIAAALDTTSAKLLADAGEAA
jgi:transcriptional regulator with XRE-family HTH domain